MPAVLRYNAVPTAVLLEVCNLANPEDRRLIETREFRQRVAEAIAYARKVVAAFEKEPSGLLVVDGKLIEKPVLREMYRFVAIANRGNG